MSVTRDVGDDHLTVFVMSADVPDEIMLIWLGQNAQTAVNGASIASVSRFDVATYNVQWTDVVDLPDNIAFETPQGGLIYTNFEYVGPTPISVNFP